MRTLLPNIQSPADLRTLSEAQLEQLAREMRETLCEPLLQRPVHFASNLGVVELAIALHLVFDFSKDRLIWDTGHQIYPHKLLTGRYEEFPTIRSRGGLMGYPNPAESDYDLFMTGHAGSSVSTMLGLKVADDLMGETNRKAVAVIGDGAFPSGIVYEALNNASGLGKDMIIILNDNQMSICPRVGGLAHMLDRMRTGPIFNDVKRNIDEMVRKLPVFGDSADRAWTGLKDMVKAGVLGGMLFEELGVTHVGPIDGHDLSQLRDYLTRVKEMKGPVLLHVLTEKGYGIECARQDPVTFHTPPVFQSVGNGTIELKRSKSRAFTDVVSGGIYERMAADERVCVLTAAMCQGNKLERVRDAFPDRFFDVGICESHAVAFAAGMAKSGLRPIVAIYSTFLQRSFDQVFQEVSLQNLPVTFCLDRAGFTGPDGPTHHGNYDIPYMRMFPNMVVMAPGDESDVGPMLDFALSHDGPVSLRYPKATPARVERDYVPLTLGQAEVIEWGVDGCLLAFGAVLDDAVEAASRLRERGLEVGVINARFCKPLDTTTIFKAISELPFVLTIEEGGREGGFGSAVLEAANDAGLPTQHLRRLGVPDRYVLHAERREQMAECGLDVDGIVRAALTTIQQLELTPRSAVTEDADLAT